MDNMDNENINSNKKLSSSQLRKIKKPLIEKRRRERINESLTQLKSLILEALNKDESQYNKMEKADILELTVKHLKNIHKSQETPIGIPQITISQPFNQPVQITSPKETIRDNYRAGFTHCAAEVKQYIQSIGSLRPEVKNHISNHLNGKLQDMTCNSLESSDNTVQTNNGAAYVQILPKEGNNMNGTECSAPQIIQGVPCLQSIPVLNGLNGQTIFLASAAVQNFNGHQMQPVLQIAQPVMQNSNLQQQSPMSPQFGSPLSPQFGSEHLNSMNGNKNNMQSNSTFVNRQNNVNTNEQYTKQSHRDTSYTHTVVLQNQNKNLNNNMNIPHSKGKSEKFNSTESKSSTVSINTSENKVLNKQNYFRNLNTLNLPKDQKSPSSSREYKDRESIQNLPTRGVSQYPFVYNHFQQPQILDNMWRPW